jgi:hypothetical protein
VKPVVVVLCVLALAVPVAYAAAGGGSYAPTPVADPCQPRPWKAQGGVSGVAAQLALSATDGAACRLHVSREELVLAFATRADLEAFGAAHHLSSSEIESAMRDGLQRAVNDAERAKAIGALTAFLLGQAAQRLPLDGLLRALQGTTLNW